jgi:hypothetical protein
MNTLGTQYLLAQGSGTNFEVLRKQCWAIVIGGLDVTLLATACSLPKVNIQNITLHHFNEEVKGPGKPTTGDMTVQILDVISPDIFTALTEWANEVYDPKTGYMGYSGDCKRQIKVKQMDQKGNVIRTWTCVGCWPKNHPSPEGSLDYSSHEPIKLDMTFSVDRCFPGESTGTGGVVGASAVTGAIVP